MTPWYNAAILPEYDLTIIRWCHPILQWYTTTIIRQKQECNNTRIQQCHDTILQEYDNIRIHEHNITTIPWYITKARQEYNKHKTTTQWDHNTRMSLTIIP